MTLGDLSILQMFFLANLYSLCLGTLFIPKWKYDAESFPGTGPMLGAVAATAGFLLLSVINTIRWILREDAFWAMVHLPLVIGFTILLTKSFEELRRAKQSVINQEADRKPPPF